LILPRHCFRFENITPSCDNHLTKGLIWGIIYSVKTIEQRGAQHLEKNEALEQLAELSARIKELPKGYISKKTIGGKIYYYHQWSENGSKQSRYIRDDEVEPLAKLIAERKELQAQASSLKSTSAKKSKRNEVNVMKCILMHKRIPVATIELDDATGFIQKIGEIYAPEHLPIGISVKNGIADRTAFNTWWTDRSIPASRSGIREALETLEIENTKMLLIRCYGLSLSDQYWIKPDGNDLTWDDINFFHHPFSDDIGDVLFGAPKKANALNFSSPDNTSDGFLKKRWKIIDGKRCLIKGGSNPFRQQPFNEVIATEIMARLNIPHVPYTLIWNNDAPYSVCEDFVDENTELIPAWRVMMTQKKNNSTSVYQHFVNCCEALGVKDVVPFLDRMITLDYIIANEDRHFNNFGLIRNAETLEWIGMAPIYDSGSSLGYDKLPGQMKSEKDVGCKPFKNHHIEQLRLVQSFDWLDLSKLNDVDEVIRRVLSEDTDENYIDEYRINAVTNAVKRRLGNLEQIIKERQIESFVHSNASTEDDVEENIAEDYSPKMKF